MLISSRSGGRLLGGVSEPALVHLPYRCQADHQGVATGLQSEPPTQLAGIPVTSRILVYLRSNRDLRGAGFSGSPSCPELGGRSDSSREYIRTGSAFWRQVRIISRLSEKIGAAAKEGSGILLTDHYHQYVLPIAEEAYMMWQKQCYALQPEEEIDAQLRQMGYFRSSKSISDQ